jgi:antirestriction protein ArdC
MEDKMEKFDVAEMVTEKILAALDKGEIPWRKPWRGGLPCNLISKAPYQGINLFILAMSDYKSRYWLTYKQAIAKGGSVKKGEKGTAIVFWSPVKFKKLNNVTNLQETKVIPILKYFTIFNLDQCQGIEAPVEESLNFVPVEKCEEIIKGYTDMPKVTHGGGRACYSPSLDEIRMPHKETFESVEKYYSVLFHEGIHSTGHKTRLDRDLTGLFGDHDYSFEELVAELGAGMLCAHAGIEAVTLDNSAAYIQSWIKKLSNDKKMIIKAAGKSKKAVAYILGTKDATEQKDAE